MIQVMDKFILINIERFEFLIHEIVHFLIIKTYLKRSGDVLF